MDTLNYIVTKFGLDLNQKSPISILPINRLIMAKTLCELGMNHGVEIGVAKGEHSELLCQNNPNLILSCVDPWQGYKGYRDYLDKRLNYFYEEAVERLEMYNTRLIRKFSTEAAKDFGDESMDFVYIDGAHDLWNVVNDITLWYPKVRKGGIIYGHDYKRSTNAWQYQQVVDAVNAYTYANKIEPWFVLGEMGHNNGVFKEGTRSWMWVKP